MGIRNGASGFLLELYRILFAVLFGHCWTFRTRIFDLQDLENGACGFSGCGGYYMPVVGVVVMVPTMLGVEILGMTSTPGLHRDSR